MDIQDQVKIKTIINTTAISSPSRFSTNLTYLFFERQEYCDALVDAKNNIITSKVLSPDSYHFQPNTPVNKLKELTLSDVPLYFKEEYNNVFTKMLSYRQGKSGAKIFFAIIPFWNNAPTALDYPDVSFGGVINGVESPDFLSNILNDINDVSMNVYVAKPVPDGIYADKRYNFALNTFMPKYNPYVVYENSKSALNFFSSFDMRKVFSDCYLTDSQEIIVPPVTPDPVNPAIQSTVDGKSGKSKTISQDTSKSVSSRAYQKYLINEVQAYKESFGDFEITMLEQDYSYNYAYNYIGDNFVISTINNYQLTKMTSVAGSHPNSLESSFYSMLKVRYNSPINIDDALQPSNSAKKSQIQDLYLKACNILDINPLDLAESKNPASQNIWSTTDRSFYKKIDSTLFTRIKYIISEFNNIINEKITETNPDGSAAFYRNRKSINEILTSCNTKVSTWNEIGFLLQGGNITVRTIEDEEFTNLIRSEENGLLGLTLNDVFTINVTQQANRIFLELVVNSTIYK